MSIWKGYSFAWVTLVLFIGSLAGHWIFGWYAYVDEQAQHNVPVNLVSFWIEIGRDTMENWQSEFLQLLWQVGGLAFLLFIGSPQSKEEGDRVEEKLDLILTALRPEDADKLISELDLRYPGRKGAQDN